MLRSRDFLDLEAVEAQRRWWHNRAIHDAYGVSEGLEISPVSSNSSLSAVTVCPGIAYDCFGRELILERLVSVPFPSSFHTDTAATIALLIRYQTPQCDLRAGEIRELCWTQAGPMRPGTAEIAWKRKERFQASDGVLLGEVTYRDAWQFTPGFIARRSRALARPTLASGTTIPGNTAWEPWSTDLRFGDDSFVIGVQTAIDASSAGFTQEPVYFAWLEGSLWNPQTRQLVPALFPSLVDESLNGFTFRLLLQFHQVSEVTATAVSNSALQFVTAGDFPSFARQQNLYVSWIGCQCNCLREDHGCCAGGTQSGILRRSRQY